MMMLSYDAEVMISEYLQKYFENEMVLNITLTFALKSLLTSSDIEY